MGKTGARAATVAILLACVLPAWAGPLEECEVGATANWVVHANVEAFRATHLGKLVLAELEAQGVDQQLQTFTTIFSFHPLRDVRDVTLYGSGQDRTTAVAIIDGKFDPERLVAVVRWNESYQEISYQGATLHRWRDEKKEGQTDGAITYGYIHEGRQVVISSGLETLKQAVDTLKTPATEAPAESDGTRAGGTAGVFVHLAATNVGKIFGQDPKAAVLQQADSIKLVAGETGGQTFARLTLQATSSVAAENIKKVFDGIVAMISLAAQEQPKLSKVGQHLLVSVAEKTVEVRFSAETSVAFELIKEQWERNRQQQKPTP